VVLIFPLLQYEASNQSGVAADHGSTVVSQYFMYMFVSMSTHPLGDVSMSQYSLDVVINIFSCTLDMANRTIQGDSVGYHILKAHKTAARHVWVLGLYIMCALNSVLICLSTACPNTSQQTVCSH